MAKFTIKCLLLASLFFFGVLFGMQEANEGIQEVKGIDHLPKVEESAGSAPASTKITEKRERLQDIQTFNVFSAVGNAATESVTGIFRKGVNVAATIIENLLG
ncbi:MAG TPA: DUF3679 domain-containing protein [Bacillales bacterium]|nr:DUF3679 domain-containing protein [Bacillales bacterium]